MITYHTWESIGPPYGDFKADEMRPYNAWSPGMNIMIRTTTLPSTKRGTVPETANYYLTVVSNPAKGRELRLVMPRTWFQNGGDLHRRQTFERYREGFTIKSLFKKYDWLGLKLHSFYRKKILDFIRLWSRDQFALDIKKVPLWYKWIQPRNGKLIIKESKMISKGVTQNIAQIEGTNTFVTFPFGPTGPWAEWDMVHDREVLHPYLQDGHLDMAKGIGILVDKNFKTEETTPLWYLLNHQKDASTLTTQQSQNGVQFVLMQNLSLRCLSRYLNGQNYSIPLSFKYKHKISFGAGALPSVFHWTLKTDETLDSSDDDVSMGSDDDDESSSDSDSSDSDSYHSSDDDDENEGQVKARFKPHRTWYPESRYNTSTWSNPADVLSGSSSARPQAPTFKQFHALPPKKRRPVVQSKVRARKGSTDV